MIRLMLLFTTLLAACTPQTGTIISRDTGLTGSYTRQIVISDHPNYVLMGHLIDGTRNGARIRALVINHRRDGVNRVDMREAWSDGQELPFRATNRRLDGCTHGHCRDHAVGLIVLSEHDFALAMLSGLQARLIGSGDGIDIDVPASLFASLPDDRARRTD